MGAIPFTVYDFFAYLSSGSVLVLTADYIFETGLLARSSINSALGASLVIAAYICGQIVAQCSAFAFEQVLIGRILGRPATVLLAAQSGPKALTVLFPNYFRALPKLTQERVRQQATSRDFNSAGESLFLHAYAVVTHDQRMQERLDSFRNQYGFARNVSFAFLLAAISILTAHHLGQAVHLRWVAIAAVASICLFYRYLKFFRQFSYELLLRYAELNIPVGVNQF